MTKPDPRLLDDGPVGWRFKGLPPGAADKPINVIAAGANMFDAGFSWPVLVLREDKLVNNASVMAGFVAGHSVSLAPHLKTSMSPALAEYALREGAWGVTVATPFQARVFMAAGHRRLLVANELVDTTFAAEAVDWLDADAGRELYCYVDSVDGVQLLDQSLSGRSGRKLPVLVEMGHVGGRGGCRDLDTVAAVARAVHTTRTLALAGVAGYEGSVSHNRNPDGLNAVRAYLHTVKDAMTLILPHCDDTLPEWLVSAGGSLYFDLVAEHLVGAWPASTRIRVVIRPGAYLTHDDGLYHMRSPLDGNAPAPDTRRLESAIEIWASVLSRPEPTLAIIGAGRRDVNFDSGLPVVRELRDHTGQSRHASDGFVVTELNDQHAFLQVPEDADVGPGDLVRFGISHPCTLHDRWLTAVIADRDDMVVSIARCYF